MDYVEPVEFVEESLDDLGPKAVVTIDIKYKSGTEQQVVFNVPMLSPIYSEPITAYTVYEILSSAYSFGEAPFLSLPLTETKNLFLDLTATDYITVEVVEVD
jgi:hypothetical protein